MMTQTVHRGAIWVSLLLNCTTVIYSFKNIIFDAAPAPIPSALVSITTLPSDS